MEGISLLALFMIHHCNFKDPELEPSDFDTESEQGPKTEWEICTTTEVAT